MGLVTILAVAAADGALRRVRTNLRSLKPSVSQILLPSQRAFLTLFPYVVITRIIGKMSDFCGSRECDHIRERTSPLMGEATEVSR